MLEDTSWDSVVSSAFPYLGSLLFMVMCSITFYSDSMVTTGVKLRCFEPFLWIKEGFIVNYPYSDFKSQRESVNFS